MREGVEGGEVPNVYPTSKKCGGLEHCLGQTLGQTLGRNCSSVQCSSLDEKVRVLWVGVLKILVQD